MDNHPQPKLGMQPENRMLMANVWYPAAVGVEGEEGEEGGGGGEGEDDSEELLADVEQRS